MILFIQTAFLGDLLLSIPTLKRLRFLYPNKEIHLICRKELAAFFLEHKLVDVAYTQYKGRKPTWSELKLDLSQIHFDLLVCPHESFRSHFLAYKISAKHKIGYRRWWNHFVFDSSIERPLFWPEALRQLSLLQGLDSDLNKKLSMMSQMSTPFVSIPEWSLMSGLAVNSPSSVYKMLSEKCGGAPIDQFICLAPGSVWATKKWGDESYRKLAEIFVQSNYKVIILGSRSEADVGEFVKAGQASIFNLCGKTSLTEMADILSISLGLICNDSGAMHMASVVETPTVALFGPTVQKFGYQPWNPKACVLEDKKLSCRPCSPHGTHVCPIGTHICMKNISAEVVFQKALQIFRA